MKKSDVPSMVFVRPEKIKGKRGRPRKLNSTLKTEKNEPTKKRNKKAVQHERLPRKIAINPTTGQKHCFTTNLPNVDFTSPTGLNSPSFYMDSPSVVSPISIASPSLIVPSPTAYGHFSRFPFFYPNTPPTVNIQPKPSNRINTSPNMDANNNFKTSPLSIHTHTLPLTPMSKKSSDYSIESLLKVKTPEEKNHPTLTPPPVLTPPTSPHQFTMQDIKRNERVHESLLRILEKVIARIHAIPAFQELSGDRKLSLLEENWMQTFLLGLHEEKFPIDTVLLYLQNMIKLHPGVVDYQGLMRMDIYLRKLDDYGIDETEMAYLRAISILKCDNSPTVTRLSGEARNMLLDYDQKSYPELIARPQCLISLVNNLQLVPNSLGKLLFPKLSDVKNFVHHIHTTLTQENMRQVTLVGH